jgi:hypothetical protein
MLSVHPGKGSFQIGMIIDGRKIIDGKVSIDSATSPSAKALVYAYVLGAIPKILTKFVKNL